MPTGIFQDDKGNNSSMRVVFIVFMIVTVMLLTIITALIIRASLEGSDAGDLNDLIKWLTTGGLGGFLAKLAQKKLEKTETKTEPTKKTYEEHVRDFLDGKRDPKPINEPINEPSRTHTEPIPNRPIPIIVIDRFSQTDKVTLGRAGVWNGSGYLLNFVTLELPWKDNQNKISCIPAGRFNAIATKRASNGKYAIWIQDVLGRSGIMIHTGNYTRDIMGCILPGQTHADIDKDGITDVTRSQSVMNELERFYPIGTQLEVLIRYI
jgi:hypothetical protein